MCMLVRRYVEQNDIHSPQVTVGESLMFSAQLRLMDVKKHDLTLFVNEVSFRISLLGHPVSLRHLMASHLWTVL